MLLSLIAILATSLFVAYSGGQSLQGSEPGAEGRLYYQSSFDSFGTEPATLPPSLILLGSGAKWAAGNGSRALFVDWYDNYLAHHLTDGATWGPWPPEEQMQNETFAVSYALNQSGLNVELAGDIPDNLTGYDVVVLSAYWAVEPRHCSLVQNYLANGGGVVLVQGVSEYFRCYCKDWWTYTLPTDPQSIGIDQWMGFDAYVNAGGDARVAVDNPFNTSLMTGDLIFSIPTFSSAAVTGGDAQVIATWDIGYTFACAHTYSVVPEPPPTPPEIPQGNLSIPPSMVLFGGGAKWAAGNGTNALYVDWYDNWIVHHKTDGTNWGPWPPTLEMKNWTESIAYVLNQSGLNVQFAGDIPANLTGYDVVIIHAYWAVDPSQCSLIQNFIANGGGVVILTGVPEYFRSYCKDWWPYRCPTDNQSLGMQDWFGNGSYTNTGGNASITLDNPFNTSLHAGDVLMQNCGYSNAAIVDGDAQILAQWQDGTTFAFAREYGQGRLYYQAAFENLDPPNRPGPVGDVSGTIAGVPDGTVNMRDVAYLVSVFQTKPDSPKWNPAADFNGDNVVNMRDIAVAIQHFNEH